MKAALAATALGWAALAAAEEFVPFVIPGKVDPRSQIAFASPAAVAPGGPRIVVRDGHFHLGGRRVRIWGVNLCFGANFPAGADAERVARRLAAAGINSVRFHHMDSTSFPRGIWDRRNPRKLSPEALDRLDWFLDRLARHGIRANINLHVSRTHSRALKLPDSDKLRNYDKIVGLFTPKLIEAQKAYARDLLTHVNKYRKVRYADDPAVAFVEITNENSLFMWGARQTLASLPPYYAGLLRERHAAWLKGRYGTTARLRAAWARGAEPLGKDLLTDGAFRRGAPDQPGQKAWRLEQHGECLARPAGTAEGLRVEIARADGPDWHIQLNQGGLALRAGRYYTVSFRARADGRRRIAYNVGQAHAPWKMLGLARSADLTRQWRPFRAGFVASADDADARVNFQLGGSKVAVELADVRLCPGGREGLRAGESLEAGGVAVFAESETPARLRDRWRFLAETEKAYFDGMYAFLKTELGCKALVTGTIVFGPLGLWGQSGMDYLDGHAYWQHPRFPGRPWDPANWTVEQKAMVDHPDASPLFGLAAQRLAGKPYTVSEYNHPAPNDYQAECVPAIAAFAAAQDFNGVWLFAYSHRGDQWDRRHFDSFFDIQANPAKWGFVPAGGAIFRRGGIGPLAASRRVGLCRSGDTLGDLIGLHLRHDRDMFGAAAEADAELPAQRLTAALAVSLGRGVRKPAAAATSGTALKWSAPDGRGGLLTATGVGAWVWIGRPAGPAGDDGPAGGRARGPVFSVITCTALDGRGFKDSRKVLVTACGRCENTGMAFSKDRRTVGRNWGGPPVRIQPVAHTIRLPLTGRWRCHALAPDGRAASEVPLPAGSADGSGGPVLPLSAKHKTMWYLLTRE